MDDITKIQNTFPQSGKFSQDKLRLRGLVKLSRKLINRKGFVNSKKSINWELDHELEPKKWVFDSGWWKKHNIDFK